MSAITNQFELRWQSRTPDAAVFHNLSLWLYGELQNARKQIFAAH